MKKESRCPSCLSIETNVVKTIADYPAIIFPVDETLVESIDVKTLEICRCSACGHLFQQNIDLLFNKKIYTEYYEFYPYNDEEHFVEHYRLPFEKLFSSVLVDKDEKKLLEIGVSSRKQLEFFEDHGYVSMGITPQQIDDPSIVSSFYEDHDFGSKFDVIVSRFNMEHIIDLDVFMGKVHADLLDGGLFVAQVPNVDYYMSENILNFYAHEHSHYFTSKSLNTLLERHGFTIEAVCEYKNPSIIIVGRKASSARVSFDGYVESGAAISDEIMGLFGNGQRVVLYGASLGLSELLYSRGLREDKGRDDVVVIDDNPLARNMFMPLFGKKIIPYEEYAPKKDDIIVLMLNSIYHDVIVERIRRDGCQNTVYAICSSGLQEL